MLSQNKVFGLTIASSVVFGLPGGVFPECDLDQTTDGGYPWGAKTELLNNNIRSGFRITFFPQGSMPYEAAITQSSIMSDDEIKKQKRYKAIERSFLKHSDGLPGDKMAYIEHLANIMCSLAFTDNISAFNSIDETIDTEFRMNGNLSLTLSQFIDEEIDAPVVFSIHRGEELLVSAEMKLDELAKTVNEVLVSEKLANV